MGLQVDSLAEAAKQLKTQRASAESAAIRSQADVRDSEARGQAQLLRHQAASTAELQTAAAAAAVQLSAAVSAAERRGALALEDFRKELEAAAALAASEATDILQQTLDDAAESRQQLLKVCSPP